MLGSEPIIWDESIGICVQSDVADEVPERLRRSPVEPAAMHVNNRGPCRACVGLAHQPSIPPTVAAPKVTLCGTATCSMTPLNGPRPAVPSIWPFICATTDRKAATPTESSWLTGCITNQGAPAPVFFRMLDCIVLYSKIAFREGRNRR